jgi:hypothetical protein
MYPKEAINTGGQPSHWANQCLLFLEPLVDYLKRVRETNDMYPLKENGETETPYYHARTFYGDNGALEWISVKLSDYISQEQMVKPILKYRQGGLLR